MEEKCLIKWINITLNERFALELNTVKSLTLVSRYFASALKSYVQNNFWFDLKDQRRLAYYVPKNQKRVQYINHIAPSTTRVKFHYGFSDSLDGLLALPLTQIIFANNFNCPVSTKNLPPTLTHLEFDFPFNHRIDNLPTNLTHLKLGYHFDRNINNLPHSLKVLELGWRFNNSIDELPSNLVQLKLGYYFNREINHLPQRLRVLELGWTFNKPLNSLPSNLTHLSFGNNFTHTLANLPHSIIYLRFGNDFAQYIPSLPPKVQRVIIGRKYKQPISHLSQQIQFLHSEFDQKRNPILIPYRYEPEHSIAP
eukprot:TRINITY_DN8224_c0_g1_i1.p1 TRINITY_DN8224_c0_g1~~TRINITY_DN8224_c0_g1_i1.p1  ORF type:complete len:322 (-),score=45.44 TRINITY_DN8224_c0_g1_i1:206-1135(-)